ncbi:MAG: efflux RND transporter periplasmic adaptor subunit [Hyphomicrobiaceae bacterium]|nr:MAG: efflux RND transporter periplasmic adaptor subunit [Hyphomicrobiaceae bacterium]
MSKLEQEGAHVDLDAVLSGATSARVHPLPRSILKWSALLAIAGLALWAALSLRTASGGTRYVTDAATRGRLVVTVTATGSVQPTNKVDISSELSGTVRKVNVDFNDPVVAGQILAVLDTDKLRATIDSSRAKLAAAKAKVTEAEATVIEKERDLARKRALADKLAGSLQDRDAAQAAFDRAKAALESVHAEVGVAEADLALNDTNLGKATITSPIAGVVLKRNIDPGSTVATTLQASTLFTIAEDLKKMEVQVDIDEADVGKVKSGQKATFSVDAYPDRKFPAVIRNVRFASETVSGVVTYKGILTIDNAELLLRPGMTATAEIRTAEIQDALLVANSALRYSPPATSSGGQGGFLKRLMPGPPAMRPVSAREETGPNRTLWVLRDGLPQAVKVVVGASDGNRTEVLGGELQPGDAAIVDTIQSTK